MEGKFAASAQGEGFGEQEQGGMAMLTSTNRLFLDRLLGLDSGEGPGTTQCAGWRPSLIGGSTHQTNCCTELVFPAYKKQIL